MRRMILLALAAALLMLAPGQALSQPQARPAWTLASVLHELDREA